MKKKYKNITCNSNYNSLLAKVLITYRQKLSVFSVSRIRRSDYTSKDFWDGNRTGYNQCCELKRDKTD